MKHPILFVIAAVWSVSLASLVFIAAYEWWQHGRTLRGQLNETASHDHEQPLMARIVRAARSS